MLFTRRRNIELPEYYIQNKRIEWVEHFKYLGVTLDTGLKWTQHITNITRKANMVMAQTKKFIGKRFGLKPKYFRWIYISLVRPILTYASTVWVKATLIESNYKKLELVQRLGCLSILNAMHTTPTAGMEVILNIRPIQIHLQEIALKSHIRLVKTGNWRVPFGEEGG